MEITIAGQTWIFLMSIVLGAGLGCCYDVFRILRIAFYNPPGLILVEDILFSVICAFASVLYMIRVDEGQVRVFVLIGEAVGFALYYCTIGVLVLGLSKGIITGIKWIGRWIWRIFFTPVLWVIHFLQGIWRKISGNLAIYLKNISKNSNIHLKKQCNILYNLKKRLFSKPQRKN